jgi:hypothetical protein
MGQRQGRRGGQRSEQRRTEWGITKKVQSRYIIMNSEFQSALNKFECLFFGRGYGFYTVREEKKNR